MGFDGYDRSSNMDWKNGGSLLVIALFSSLSGSAQSYRTQYYPDVQKNGTNRRRIRNSREIAAIHPMHHPQYPLPDNLASQYRWPPSVVCDGHIPAQGQFLPDRRYGQAILVYRLFYG